MEPTKKNYIKLPVSKVVKIIEEVEIPFYCMTDCYAYKVCNPDKTLIINYAVPTHLSIALGRSENAFQFKGESSWKEITEKEYHSIYEKVLEEIQSYS